jgi:hypothetical protein
LRNCHTRSFFNFNQKSFSPQNMRKAAPHSAGAAMIERDESRIALPAFYAAYIVLRDSPRAANVP